MKRNIKKLTMRAETVRLLGLPHLQVIFAGAEGTTGRSCPRAECLPPPTFEPSCLKACRDEKETHITT